MSKLASTWMGSGVLAAAMSVALGARGQTPAVEDVPTAALPPVEATAEPPASPTAPDEAQAQAAVPTGAVACVVEPNGIDAASAACASSCAHATARVKQAARASACASIASVVACWSPSATRRPWDIRFDRVA